jgi:hypothetical protein
MNTDKQDKRNVFIFFSCSCSSVAIHVLAFALTQVRRPDGDVGLGGFANTPAPRATDDGRSDVALRSDAVEHGIEFVGQRHQLLER